MALDKLVDSSQLDADLTTVANAIRTKGGTSEQLSFPNGMAQAIAAIPSGGITPTGNINITDTNVTDVTNYATAQVVDADLIAANIKKDVNILGVVGSFEGGGTTITDGIVVKARNANGFATEVDVYGPNVSRGTFYYGERIFARDITKINGLETVVNVFQNAFTQSKINHDMIFTNLVTVGESAFERITSANGLTFSAPLLTNLGMWAFVGSTAFTSILLPSCTSYNKETFVNCSNLHTAQFGSVGHGVTNFLSNNMRGCTQNGLTVTAYCAGSYADTLLANIRNGATNATIIIKASENTTYGGNSYLAGETILTSTPT